MKLMMWRGREAAGGGAAGRGGGARGGRRGRGAGGQEEVGMGGKGLWEHKYIIWMTMGPPCWPW